MFRCLKMLPLSLKICMGMCLQQDISEESKKAQIKSSTIEQDLCDHARAERNVIKILMLGVAESGKSTIIRQMKIIHSRGFSSQELRSFKPAVLDNLLTSMKIVLQGMGKLRINLANNKNKIQARSILSCSQCLGDDQQLLPFVAQAFCALWTDQGVRAAAARGFEYNLNDSALYFFENISRIISPNYIPTEMDVLRVRVRTCGIIETQFQVDETIFRLYDVGGQRSERRKWLSCFDSSHALLFVVGLSSYDQMSFKDPSMNGFQESLEFFSSICTNTVFKKTSLILFLNKTDLFRGKILHSGRHLRFYLSSYEGMKWRPVETYFARLGADCDVDAAAHHVAAVFSACNMASSRPVYHHFSTAIDSEIMKEVFHMVIDQIIKENLSAVQLL